MINAGYQVSEQVLKNAKEKFAVMSEKQKKELQSSMSWFFLTDEIKKKTRLQIQAKMRILDLISLFLAVLGILTNILSSAWYIDFIKIYEDPNLVSIIVKPTPTNRVQILRCITSLSTFFLLICIILHYKTKLTFLIFKQKVELEATFFSSGLIYPMILEIIINMIHSFPYMDNWQVSINTTGSNPIPVLVDIDLMISVIVTLRVYLFFKYLGLYSDWADDRAEKICNECNAKGGVGFAVKAVLKERPYTATGLILFISILIFGYGLRNIELPFMQKSPINKFQDWRYIWNGLWCISITILTVSYGDLYPQTHLGRVIAVIACLWGTFLISLMVVAVTNLVNFTPQQQKAYDEIKKVKREFNLKSKAMNVIRQAVALKSHIEHNEDSSFVDDDRKEIIQTKIEKKVIRFNKIVNSFRQYRKYVMSFEHEISTELILSKLNQCVSDDMEELINFTNLNVKSLIGYINYSKEMQKQIKDHTEKLNILTKGLHDCIK